MLKRRATKNTKKVSNIRGFTVRPFVYLLLDSVFRSFDLIHHHPTVENHRTICPVHIILPWLYVVPHFPRNNKNNISIFHLLSARSVEKTCKSSANRVQSSHKLANIRKAFIVFFKRRTQPSMCDMIRLMSSSSPFYLIIRRVSNLFFLCSCSSSFSMIFRFLLSFFLSFSCSIGQ